MNRPPGGIIHDELAHTINIDHYHPLNFISYLHEVTNEETSGTEEVHSLTDEFAKQNDTRNVLAASEEIGDLIRAPKGAAAAAKEPATAAKAAASAPAAAQDSDEIAKLMKQHLKAMEEATTAAKEAAAAAKEAASTPATGSVCCTIM